jgi:hypothetical protein
LIEVNYGAPVKVWRNVGSGDATSPATMGDWIGIRLAQAGPNQAGVGSWIEVRVGDRILLRELTIGGGHAGGQLGWLHFGLGEAAEAEVRVQWPDGQTGSWLRVGANQFVEIERDVLEPRIIDPSND